MLRALSKPIEAVRAKVSEFVRNAKIALDYARYDREQWSTYQRQVEQEFSVASFEAEIDDKMGQIGRELRDVFDDAIKRSSRALELSTAELRDHERGRSLLQKNFQALLTDAYRRLDETKEQLNVAFEQKRSAFHDRDEAQSSIDWWYGKANRSGWLLGNAGKKIPNHSLFGQSHGDLAAYKSHRADAYARIGWANARIVELKSQKAAIGSEIAELKGERDAARALIREGLSVERLGTLTRREQTNLAALQSELAKLAQERDDMLNRRKVELGVDVLESKIRETIAAKEKRLAAYHDDDAVAERRAAHRVLWLERQIGPAARATTPAA